MDKKEIIKMLKDFCIWVAMFAMMFLIVYMLVLAADAEYEVSQERERAYFDRVEDLRR